MLAPILEWFGALAAAIGICLSVWKGGRKVVAVLHRWYHRVDEITRQLAPNGGTSLVDRVARIEQLADETRTDQLIGLYRHRTIGNILGLAYWEADQEGNYRYISDHLASLMMGHSSQFLGSGWIAAVHPEDRDRVSREWSACVRAGGRFALTFRYWGSGADIEHVRAIAEPIVDPYGTVHHWMGIVEKEHTPT